MRKISFLFLLSAFAIFITSCGDSKDGILNVEKLEHDINPDGGIINIEVDAAGSTITATPEDSWVKADVDGNTIRLTVETNYSASDRTGKIEVSANNTSAKLTLVQAKLEVTVENYSSAKEVYIDGSSEDIIITANADNMPVSLEVGENTWIKYTVEGKTVKVQFEPASQPREGTFDINVGPYTYPVEAKQSVLSYNYFLGEFSWFYTNDFMEEIEMTVSFEKKAEGESYIFKCERMLYDFEIRYDSENGSLSAKPQLLDEEEVKDHWLLEDGTYQIWLAFWGTDYSFTSPTISPDSALLGEVQFTDAGIMIVWVDGGGWADGELDCFNIAYFDEDRYQFDKYSLEFEATYFDMSMKKK